jgi:hypothetical protein
MLTLPGYFYYEACIYYQDDGKGKYFGLALAVLGQLCVVFVLSVALYFKAATATMF